MCIQLRPGLDINSLPKTRTMRVIYLEEALERIEELRQDWIQAAEDTDEDLTHLPINVLALFCDIKRLIEEL